MTSTSLNKETPFSHLGPSWAGVEVLVTQTGFQNPSAASDSPYGFNLGTHVGDNPDQVNLRRDAVQSQIGAPIVWLNQVHGCDVFAITNDHLLPLFNSKTPNADASVAVSTDVALAIMTADCLPVVFAAFDAQGKAVGVAAAHAGWRGLWGGVLQATANSLAKACNVPTGQLNAWLGPAIGPQSFEVGQEVFEAFVQQSPLNEACFKPGSIPGKYLADIYELARVACHTTGIQHLEGGGLDTLTDLRWFSHRRGQQQGLPSGRFATLIRLLPAQDA